MKASEIYKTAAELYRAEVSGGGVPVKVDEIGLSFHVFPQQPSEGGYIGSASAEEMRSFRSIAVRYIAARAKDEKGHGIFDNENERELWRKSMNEKCPSVFSEEVAERVFNEINSAFEISSIEEAGNESEDAPSSDSTSA